MALRVFIRYTHDTPEHEALVWSLSDRLRNDGVPCHIDQHEEFPSDGWPLWCSNQIERANFVLVICTKLYRHRYLGKGTPGKGYGGNWEGVLIRNSIYNERGKNRKFVPLVLSSSHVKYIPKELSGFTHYDLSQSDWYDKLFALIANLPRRKPSPVASQLRLMPALPESEIGEREPGAIEFARIQVLRRENSVDDVVGN